LREVEATFGENESEIEDRKTKSFALKSQGNQEYQAENFESAAKIYTEALNLCPLRLKEDRAVMYSNRGACFLRMDLDELATGDSSKALELKPDYLKPLFRRAQIYEKKEETWEKAFSDYQEVLKLDPRNLAALDGCRRLPPMINERNERMKTEMMGKLKDLGNVFLRPFGLSCDNFKMEEQPGGGYSVKLEK